MSHMRVLVTGAGGFVGRAVISRLSADCINVVALVRNSDVSIPGATTVIGDMTDPDSLAQVLTGVDAVVHLAAAKSDEQDSYAVNVSGMRNLIRACTEAGTDYIVFVSTASVKIERKGLYASTKREAERLLEESGIPHTILRPSVIYGDLKSGVFGALVRAARLPVVPVFGDGLWLSWPIHVDDVACAISIALQKELQSVYDVGGPDRVTFDEIIQGIRTDVLHRSQAIILHIPAFLGMMAARFFSAVTSRPPITVSNILGSTQNISWDADTFFRDFDFRPRTLAAGLQELGRMTETSEADIFFAYVYSRSGIRYKPSQAMRERYAYACAQAGIGTAHPLVVRHPILIGMLDAATALRSRDSGLHQRLRIASALVETDVESAQWLLPRERRYVAIFGAAFLLGCSAVLKIVAGSCLTLIPGFLQTYGK